MGQEKEGENQVDEMEHDGEGSDMGLSSLYKQVVGGVGGLVRYDVGGERRELAAAKLGVWRRD